MKLPTRSKGRQSKESIAKYNLEVSNFAKDLIRIQDVLGFKLSGRGWGYYTEGMNLITKAEFSTIETVINDMRKSGALPIDFTASDTSRATKNITEKDYSHTDELKYQRDSIINFIEGNYTSSLLEERTKHHIELLVEKVDLIGLFKPICEKYQIPMSNAKGWSDINSRADLLKRCHTAKRKGFNVSVLYFGDLDAGGVHISEFFMDNIRSIATAVGVDPDNIEDTINFKRVGLDYDYIIKHNLTWVDNLITGSGKDLASQKHKDHFKPYVQDYISKYGTKKCEANALLKDVSAARDYFEGIILSIIDEETFNSYQDFIKKDRDELLEKFTGAWSIDE